MKRLQALSSCVFSQMRPDFSVTLYTKDKTLITVYAAFYREREDEEEMLVLRAIKGMPISSKYGSISFCTSPELTENGSKLVYLEPSELKEGFWNDIKEYLGNKQLTVTKENPQLILQFVQLFSRRQQISWESKE